MTGATQFLSDDRLARRATRGDQRAFEAIYNRYHQSLYRFCLAMVGGNPQDAQDALQNTMVKVLRALPGEQRQIQLKPWLYRIARNEAVEMLRRRRDSVELEPELTVAGEEIAQTVEDRERLRVLFADLDALPERQRAALVMRELAGFGFEEIGAAFGSSPAVARQTLYEARLSLREMEGGREMSCEDVMRKLSDADGRVTRRRELRAHLRGCPACRAFRDEIGTRRNELAAIAPLPLAVSAGLLHGVLGAQASAGGSAGAAAGATAGKAVATSAIAKSAAAVAVVAVAGVSAAGRSGLVDVPLPGLSQSGQGAESSAGSPAANGSSAGEAAGGGAGAPNARSESSRSGLASAARRHREGTANATAVGGPQNGGSSLSEAGQNPPGGGYGRTAAGHRGRPDRLPQASEHGQQTAAAHKPIHAASPPGHSPAHSRGKSAASKGAPRSKPASPTHSKGPAAKPPPSQPPTDAPPTGRGNPDEPPTGGRSKGVEP